MMGAVLGFITLPIIAWHFSASDIGKMALLNTVISFSILFFSFGLDQAYIRYFHQAENKAELFTTVLIPGFIFLIILSVIFLSNQNIVSKVIFEESSFVLSFFVILMVISSFLSRFLSLILRMNEKGIAYSMSQIFPKIFLILIVLYYMVNNFEKNFYYLILGYLIANILVCSIYTWNTRKFWFSRKMNLVNFDLLKEMLVFSYPLILGGVAFWGLISVDKLMLKQFSDYNQLGLYSVSVSFAAIATILQSVFSIIWSPIVYKWAEKEVDLNRVNQINRYILLAVVLIFSFVGCFSWLLKYILPYEYYLVQSILLPCLGYPLFYTLSETTVIGIGITKRTIYSMLSTLLALFLNIILCFLLIPKYGAIGAAISTCIAFWFFLIFRTEFSIYVWKKMPRLVMYSWTIWLLICAIINALFGELYSNFILYIWLLTLLFALLFFKNEVFYIFSFLRKKIFN